MKKAYELSVLCGVSVSLLIFSGNGKPYEFSSTDFDTEVDRYNEYEGTIERRRGVEFEAMARAGEDDDDDEDEDDIKPGAAKKAGPSKSLKGKESFKARRSVRYEERRRDKHPIEETFVGALVDETNDESPRSRERSDVSLCLRLMLTPVRGWTAVCAWYACEPATKWRSIAPADCTWRITVERISRT